MMTPLVTNAQKARPTPHKSSHKEEFSHTEPKFVIQCVNQNKVFPTQCPNQRMTPRIISVFSASPCLYHLCLLEKK